jgi:isopentenyl-diphosphate Delta-isomerase
MVVTNEEVVLLDDDGTPIGRAAKSRVHDRATPLHLAFSCHLFDERGRVLVTRRALGKSTWPGVWTNSFCGHPRPAESIVSAIARRATEELGITVTDVCAVLPRFRYRAVDASGTVENELCPVFTARSEDTPAPNADEVMELRWVDPAELGEAVARAPWAFSPWLALQARALPFLSQTASRTPPGPGRGLASARRVFRRRGRARRAPGLPAAVG